MNTYIDISGYIVGPIWWPTNEKGYKPFRHNVKAYNARLSKPGTLRDHVLAIIQDGDFQSCEIADGIIEITITKPNRSRSRSFDLSLFPSVADCVKLDWGGPARDDWE